MIKIENLHIKKPKKLLESCELIVHRGAVTGILGRSGCGKTTVLTEIALMGHHQFDKYIFDDVDIKKLSSKEKNEFIRQNICFVMQDIYLFEDLTIEEILRLYGKLNNKELDVEEIHSNLEYVNLSLDLHTPISLLSGGEKQRLCIACGLLKDAELYIFDEPFAYLDRNNAKSIFEIIQKIAYEKKKYVLVATHDNEIASHLDMTYIFKDGILNIDKSFHTDIKHTGYDKGVFNKDVLKYYLNLYFKNNKIKIVIQSVMLGFIISMLMIVNQYNNNFQKMHGESLLNIMKNEVIINRKEGKKMMQKHIVELKSRFSDYDVYVPIAREGMNVDWLLGYLENEESTFDVYKEKSDTAYINNQKIDGKIYISYELARNIEGNTYTFYDFEMKPIEVTVTDVLMPSEHNGIAVYIPYSYYMELLEENNIDINNIEMTYAVIPITSVSEIDKIQKSLPIGYELWMESTLSKSKDIAAVFEKEYIHIFMILIFIAVVFYKVYDILKIKNDVILFKMTGISHRSIIQMKAIQELYATGYNIMVSLVIVLVSSIILEVFMIETYIYMIFLILICNALLYAFIMMMYGLVIIGSKPSKLLRSVKV